MTEFVYKDENFIITFAVKRKFFQGKFLKKYFKYNYKLFDICSKFWYFSTDRYSF